jgi:hypothetical protein
VKITVAIDQAQLDDLKDRLAFIKHGYERAVVRAMNYAANQAKSATQKKVADLLTADPDRIKESMTVRKATFTQLSAVLNIRGQPIPLFRFDVTFMYPTVTGGVTAQPFRGGKSLPLKHAFVAKVPSGSSAAPGPNHWGVFSRQGEKRRMTRGRYAGQVRQPIVEHFGPHVATVFAQTPGLEAEIMQLAAEKFAHEVVRQAEFLIQKELGDGDE